MLSVLLFICFQPEDHQYWPNIKYIVCSVQYEQPENFTERARGFLFILYLISWSSQSRVIFEMFVALQECKFLSLHTLYVYPYNNCAKQNVGGSRFTTWQSAWWWSDPIWIERLTGDWIGGNWFCSDHCFCHHYQSQMEVPRMTWPNWSWSSCKV